ncbi:MAG: carbonic anhydrase [Arcobacter sp.]|nr:MAG: carbonic anhydrase [Arcobacter sp.]
MISKLIKGNQKFKDTYFHKLEGKFDHLIEYGQSPDVLFIGCSDSRVVPDLIMDSKPGDMFILRNIGNFVPKYKKDNDFHGSSAAIEYAVSVLHVRDIIICGHSHCGACESLYKDLSQDEHLIHVRKWLELGAKAKEITLSKIKDKTDMEAIYRMTEKESIKIQLENLLTYPEILRKIKSGQLDIHGWYYKIENGSIEYLNGETNNFEELK